MCSATGEPPFCLSCSVLFALRNAVESARKDAGMKETWFDISKLEKTFQIFPVESGSDDAGYNDLSVITIYNDCVVWLAKQLEGSRLVSC